MAVDARKALELLSNANELKDKGDKKQALLVFQEYLNMVDPSFTHGVWNTMAEILFENQDYEKALSHCNRALELMKEFIPALELRAKIQNALGNTTAMKNDLNTINKLNAIEQAKWDDPNHYYHYK
ncbi:tetratricopeptide repeat protein [Leptospira paudalimensis]|uniref:Tetratricopeptide repeat protein n=1 Tax=Leptospira paudalimensis TaxID=2950024 RepID=A0ABT3M5E0_9LEPT|nr:tetratricopeptide repeat protein [Leptospira paudalimensis]MCW7503610.1 tetratricopeptide repeat protein [Leptospira paudalimensis]